MARARRPHIPPFIAILQAFSPSPAAGKTA